jgi:hypothetical protein
LAVVAILNSITVLFSVAILFTLGYAMLGPLFIRLSNSGCVRNHMPVALSESRIRIAGGVFAIILFGAMVAVAQHDQPAIHFATDSTIQSTTNARANDTIVYVTRTGGKYHRAGCQYLRQSRIPMALTAR